MATLLESVYPSQSSRRRQDPPPSDSSDSEKRLRKKMQLNLVAVLPFEVLVNIFKNLHFVHASPLKRVCKDWYATIDELFVFYPTTPSPFKLSINKYFLNKSLGERNQFNWNNMILNFLQHVVPHDCNVITIVIRVIEHKDCFTNTDNDQTDFQSKICEIANMTDVKGYIQTQSSYSEENIIKRVFDICCQGKPGKLAYFLEQVSEITNQRGELVAFMDVNFIFKSRIASSFTIKTTNILNPITQSPVTISLRDEGEETKALTDTTESMFTLNTYTFTKANIAKIKVTSLLDKTCLGFVGRDECPPIILTVFSLYLYEDFKQPILELISSLRDQVKKVLYQYLEEGEENLANILVPLWKELKKKCAEFLENNTKAKHVLTCSSITPSSNVKASAN